MPLTFTLGLSSGRNSASRLANSATAIPASHRVSSSVVVSPLSAPGKVTGEYKESCVLKLWKRNFFVLLPQIKNSRSEPGSHPQGRSAAEEARSALTPRASVG